MRKSLALVTLGLLVTVAYALKCARHCDECPMESYCVYDREACNNEGYLPEYSAVCVGTRFHTKVGSSRFTAGGKGCNTMDNHQHFLAKDDNALFLECGKREVVNQCGNLCEKTCRHVVEGNPVECDPRCDPPACVCKTGYVRFFDGKRCVPETRCLV